MTDNAVNMEKNTYNEIDLIAVVRSLVKKIKRHRLRYLFVVSSFLGLSLLFYVLYPSRYDLVLIGSSSSIKVEALTGMAKALNTAARDRDLDLLSNTLHLPPEQAAEILGVEVKQIKPDIMVPNAAGSDGFFELKVVTSSLVNEDSMQVKFIRYFETNPSVVLRETSRKKLRMNMIAQIKIEIEKLEILRENILKGGAADPKFIMVEPGKINQTIVELYRSLNDYEYEQTTAREFQVLQGFMSPKKAAFPRLGATLLVGLLAGLILGFFVVLERED